MTVAVEVKGLSIQYPAGPQILSEVSFSVEKGELLGVTGPSGCGKSTLLLTLCGAIPHRIQCVMSGTVSIFGNKTTATPFSETARQVGAVFQDPETQLFLPRVWNELAFATENLCWSPDEIKRSVTETARLTGVSHLLDRNPGELSGGEQQLVVLTAAITADPQVIILDEVLSSLDKATVARVSEIIVMLKNRGKAVIMVEHDMSKLRIADRVLTMVKGKLRPEG